MKKIEAIIQPHKLEEVKEAVNQAMGSEDVVNVYFTEFIVQ